MRAIGKNVLVAPLLAIALVVMTGATGYAEKIAIGTFRWEVLPGSDMLECFFSDPCHYFLVENNLATLTSEQKDKLGLLGDETFSAVEIPELGGAGVIGDISADPLFNYGQAYSFDAVDAVSLLLTLPATMTGTLLPTSINLIDLVSGIASVNIFVEANDAQVPVPEPGTLGLVAIGLGSAWATRRRRSQHPS